MLLFQGRFHEPLRRGEITLTFRTWPKCKVKAGGRYRCHPIGVLEVSSVSRVLLRAVTEDDARRSGFPTRDELLAYLRAHAPLADDAELWKVELSFAGDGDRVAEAMSADLGAEDVATLKKKLARMDAGDAGPWTAKIFALIEKHPRVAASQLAKKLGWETAPFKANVVKLKKLGLTQSFEVGYELTPRGVAFRAAAKRKRSD